MALDTRAQCGRSVRGRALLCFPPHGRWFQGYVLPGGTEQLGLLGVEEEVDACVQCPDGGYQRFCVTVTDFENGQELQVMVTKRGGELCRLDSDDADDDAGSESPGQCHLKFEPQVLLRDLWEKPNC
ncbi:hypothetical protein ATCC90586_001209 [Pythium insidiosum]|nr:hypothetical protein ATCC90586_001209 [Pythium insidiosum]